MKWVVGIVILGVLGVWLAVGLTPDRNLHIVFCSVGQGDATLVFRGTTQILIDGGPGEKVLDCLARHIPFYDRRIEVMILTHAEADHINGLVPVIKRYTVLQFVSSGVGSEIDNWRELTKSLVTKKTPVVWVGMGNRLKVDTIEMDFVWPDKEWLASQIRTGDPKVGSSAVKVLGYAYPNMGLNEFSVSGILHYGNFDVWLSGDADKEVEGRMVSSGEMKGVEVMKVPHHGSKTGMTEEWLKDLSPQLAVVSVGKNNYGHPSMEALQMLQKVGARVMRTDGGKDVEIVSDGKRWWVK